MKQPPSAILLILLSLFCVACRREPVRIMPVESSVAGLLHDYFSVVERSYKLADDTVNVEIIRLREGFPKPWKPGMEIGRYDNCAEPVFTLELLDTDTDLVGKSHTDVLLDKEVLTALASLNKDEKITIPFRVDCEQAALFRMGSSFKVNRSEDKAEGGEKADARSQVPSLDSNGSLGVEAVAEVIKAEARRRQEAARRAAERAAAEEAARQAEEQRRQEAEESLSPWEVITESSKDIYHNATRKMREWLGMDD